MNLLDFSRQPDLFKSCRSPVLSMALRASVRSKYHVWSWCPSPHFCKTSHMIVPSGSILLLCIPFWFLKFMVLRCRVRKDFASQRSGRNMFFHSSVQQLLIVYLYALSTKDTTVEQTRQESLALMELTYLLGGKQKNKHKTSGGYKSYEE